MNERVSNERRDGEQRRMRDQVLLWANPALLAVCGFLLIRVFSAMDNTTSAVQQQAVTLAQMQVMLTNNAAMTVSLSSSIDNIRSEQVKQAERLVRMESRGK